jgi:hypothetical protein
MSRKRSKALDANNADRFSRKHAADAIRLDDGLGLGAVAAQLAALEGTFHLMCDASRNANRKVGSPQCMEDITPDVRAASTAEGVFDRVNRRAHDMTDTLQDLILQMEPMTVDEALSLALVYGGQMALFLCKVAECPECINEQETRLREDMLERAMHAIIRGLIHSGAASPLLERHYIDGEELTPWDQLRRQASRTAAQYGDEPAKGKGGAS